MDFKKKLKFLIQDSRPFKTRLLISAAVHLFAVFSLIFYTSVEVYISNSGDFGFAFSSMVLVMGLASIILFAVFTAISLLLKGRMLNYYLSTVFAFTFCAYLQGNFMNWEIPSLDGNSVQWHLLTRISFLNIFIWIICFSIPFIVHFFNNKFWKKLVVVLSCVLVVMQTVSMITLIVSAGADLERKDGYYSRKNLYEASRNGDVVVFVLDYFDNEYMDNLLNEDPEIISEWTGFTRFINCTSMYKQTMPSIPYILTGTKWQCETPSSSFDSVAFQKSDFLKRMDEIGAEVNLYVTAGASAKEAYEISDNYVYVTPRVNSIGMFSSLMNYSLYKNMPTITKSVFWHYTDDITNASVKLEDDSISQSTYTIDDALFYKNFKEFGIDVSKENKSFKFIHMMGAHYPFTIDETGNANNETNAPRQQKGSLHIVSEYLSEMKTKGIYDSSTVIVMADHGEVEVGEQMSRASLPILFVKPANTDSSQSLKVSNAPVSQEDFRATVLNALGDEKYSDYGRTFFETSEGEERERYFYFRVAYDGKTEESLLEYKITGDAKDFANWQLTGNVWGDKSADEDGLR